MMKEDMKEFREEFKNFRRTVAKIFLEKDEEAKKCRGKLHKNVERVGTPASSEMELRALTERPDLVRKKCLCVLS